MNKAYNDGRRAAERGFSLQDNPYQDEKSASEWEDGFYSYEPIEKIKKGRSRKCSRLDRNGTELSYAGWN